MIYPEFIKSVYGRYIALETGKVQGDEIRVSCPKHEDKSPSFSVNLKTGLFKCFNPDCVLSRGGATARFVSLMDDITVPQAQEKLRAQHDEEYPEEKKKIKKPLPKFPYTQEDVDTMVSNLLSTPEAMDVVRRFGWTEDTIIKFEIGWHPGERRYWIPIKENGIIQNIRKYSTTAGAKVINVPNFGKVRLYPIDNLQDTVIYLFEGEKDCILANQWGLNGVTNTAGASTFKSEWTCNFKDKDVIICYDGDNAGREGAEKVIRTVTNVAKSVKNIAFPEGQDFTDYAMSGKTPQDFMALVDSTVAEEKISKALVDIPDEIHETTLESPDNDKLIYKRCKMNVRVIGKDYGAFAVPKMIKVTCTCDAPARLCDGCGNQEHNGTQIKELNESNPEILQLIECKALEKKAIVKDLFNLRACGKYLVKEEGHVHICKVQIVPSIEEMSFDTGTMNQRYVERELYYIGDSLDTNKDYEIHTIAIPSPKDQTIVHVGYKVKPSDTSVEEFKLTPEMHERLKIFQCQQPTSPEN